MRMKYVIVVALLFVVSTMPSSSSMHTSTRQFDELSSQSTNNLSETVVTGVLDPLEIEQTGNWTTTDLSASTDDGTNVGTELTIDTANGWTGDIASVEMWDPERLYVVNGSMNDGNQGTTTDPSGSIVSAPFGWDAYSYLASPNEQMIADYLDGEISATGRGDKVGSKEYIFTSGNWLYWTQQVNNSPELDYFYLSFDYRFDNGVNNENVTLRVLANDTLLWNITSEGLSLGSHYQTGDIPLNLTEFNGVFDFKIGIYFAGNFNHSLQFQTFTFDNIRLRGQTSPSFDDLNIVMHINQASVGISGSTIGTAWIKNVTSWETDVVPLTFTSDYAIAFNYNASMSNHRYVDSSYELDLESIGAAYEIQSGKSPMISIYTYLASQPDLDDFTIIIRTPQDWENTTVYNPFLTDVTGSCTIVPGRITIPESLLSSLGWWQIDIESPNYMKSLSSQVSLSGSSPWTSETTFSTSEYIRTSALIGYDLEEPTVSDSVNISIFYPNGTLWYSELLTGNSGDYLNTSAQLLGSLNTSVGVWSICATWDNGTEVAFGEISFQVVHTSSLTPITDYIDAETDQVVSAFVEFKDAELDQFLLDASAQIEANWSGSVVYFTPNELQNRWEADLDTTGFIPGEYVIVVNASLQYYTYSTCQITIKISATENTVKLKESALEINLGETLVTYLNYSDASGVGIEEADIDVTSVIPSGGISWSNVVDLGSGNYSIELTGIMSGTYEIVLTASKLYYQSADDNLILIIGSYGSDIISQNGTSDSIQVGQSYRFVFRYANSSGYGLSGATVAISSITPSSGLSTNLIVDEGDGYYSVVLTPTITDAFTILFEAEATNHERKLLSFTLASTNIGTTLTIESFDEVVAIDQNCTIVLNFVNDTGNGIEGASLSIVSPPDGLSSTSFQDLGDGLYQVELIPLESGDYQVRFKATAENHVDATTSVTISIDLIQTTMEIIDHGPVFDTFFGNSLQFSFRFYRTDTSANISDAVLYLTSSTSTIPEYSISEFDGYYTIVLTADIIDVFELTLYANKTSHKQGHLDFQYAVSIIPTTVNDHSLPNLYIGYSYTYTYQYVNEEESIGIDGAEINPTGRGNEWVSNVSLGSGYYNITISPNDYGSFTLNLDFSKDGYSTASTTLGFTVISIPVEMDISTSPWFEDGGLSINVTLSILGTNIPVTGAIVQCTLSIDGIDVDDWILEEIQPGFYSISIEPDWESSDSIELSVSVTKDTYESFSESIQIIQRPYIRSTLEVFVDFIMIPLFLAVFGIIAIALSARAYGQRRDRKRTELREISQRFDDVNNLLGILILHKRSGLPLYSKILKGGFEEGMLSAFITAITHFRSEFDSNGSDDEREWKITPISDIIRAVPTKNLIFAFVTVTTPSLEQEVNMLMFAREIGMHFDDQMETPPTAVLEGESVSWIDDMFCKIMDGDLLDLYQMPSGGLPRKFSIMKEAKAVYSLDDSFRLLELSRGLVSLGLDEGEAFKLILEAKNESILMNITQCDVP